MILLLEGKGMNNISKTYWDNFWNARREEKPTAVTAWQFDDDPDDYLAQLVIDGLKTALGKYFMNWKMNQFILSKTIALF